MSEKSAFERLQEEAMLSEAMLVGILYNEPELFELFTDTELNRQTFLNDVWGFYFGLGKYLYQKDVLVFDDITVFKFIEDLKAQEKYENYGGYETVKEVMHETKGKDDNIDSYYEQVKKYEMIVKLCELYGTKVLDKEGKYNYALMSREALYNYWIDKAESIALDTKNGWQEANLLDGLDELIDELDEEPDVGLPFWDSPRLSEIFAGWADGCLYIFGSFGGRGKTTFTFNKVVTSCLVNHEKLLIIANEQSLKDFQKLLLVTALGIIKKDFKRKRLNEGGFTKYEREALDEAKAWVKQVAGGNNSLVKFIFLDSYTMSNVKDVVKKNARRGYKSLIIDTGKPGDDANGMARWQKFTEDFTELYKIIKPNGGLNIKTWVNVQLADHAIGQRFLNEGAFGDAKKIKNEASCVLMARPLHDDEYFGQKKALTVYNMITREEAEKLEEFNELPEGEMIKHEFQLRKVEEIAGKDGRKIVKYNQYYVFFVPKNRRGQDNNTGLDCLVMKPDFNANTWEEIGWTTIERDYAH